MGYYPFLSIFVIQSFSKFSSLMAAFSHLHVHTQYSILDGASNITNLMDKVKSLGMEAIAITDHGNMFGVKEFHAAATKMGIKPVIGCEIYVAK